MKKDNLSANIKLTNGKVISLNINHFSVNKRNLKMIVASAFIHKTISAETARLFYKGICIAEVFLNGHVTRENEKLEMSFSTYYPMV